ncbi:hypothetical protein AC480_02395 [miscellaneous Crenarchaeota group archaeon SMTZ1-55]|nr:MAG: hypothetical protein AC480_02395 [miscellaneous Crenarchaeota group archaeon SMTZ1-55]
MPAKGQWCANCAGDCCSIVTFEAETPPPPDSDLMDYSVNEPRARGLKEAYKPLAPCVAKTGEGCLIYEDRPRLCRSYYCHGRYWKPKRAR